MAYTLRFSAINQHISDYLVRNSHDNNTYGCLTAQYSTVMF